MRVIPKSNILQRVTDVEYSRILLKETIPFSVHAKQQLCEAKNCKCFPLQLQHREQQDAQQNVFMYSPL